MAHIIQSDLCFHYMNFVTIKRFNGNAKLRLAKMLLYIYFQTFEVDM